MTVNSTLKFLHKHTEGVRWSFDNPNRQYVAVYRSAGLKATISPAIPNHQLTKFAREVELELKATYRKQNSSMGKLRRKIRNAKAGK